MYLIDRKLLSKKYLTVYKTVIRCNKQIHRPKIYTSLDIQNNAAESPQEISIKILKNLDKLNSKDKI